MPTSHPDAAEPIATLVACPQLLTPPPEFDGHVAAELVAAEAGESVEDGEAEYGTSDNTAHGMAYEQELSMYTSHEEDISQTMAAPQAEVDKEKTFSHEGANTINGTTASFQCPVEGAQERATGPLSPVLPNTIDGSADVPKSISGIVHGRRHSPSQTDESSSRSKDETNACSRSQTSSPATQISANTPNIPPTDLYPSISSWDFTHLHQPALNPSSLLRAGSKFTGTQQSDRQIYNVDVDILTVDTFQSSLTGYLRICGLTEDHPTLTTFFSGEIIGGPTHKYSFRTCTPSWGATDKTDLIHWARFPAWRSLQKEAKRDIDFAYPLDGGEWWQQENVYMRWKEHFLVPDHRVRSIAGASFEGFYYATFNQVEGRVSGIYFHAKSER